MRFIRGTDAYNDLELDFSNPSLLTNSSVVSTVLTVVGNMHFCKLFYPLLMDIVASYEVTKVCLHVKLRVIASDTISDCIYL